MPRDASANAARTNRFRWHGQRVAPVRPMLGRAFGYVGVAFGAVLVAACRPPAAVPGRPDALRTGTFALTLRGTLPVSTLGRPPRDHTFDETVTGSACRIGEYLRLDSRRPARRVLVQLPRIGPARAAYALELTPALGAPWNPEAAHAHLNVPPALNGGFSLPIVGGSVTVEAPEPANVLGTIDARVVQRLTPDSASPEGATLRGVFRAGRCDDWPADAGTTNAAPGAP